MTCAAGVKLGVQHKIQAMRENGTSRREPARLARRLGSSSKVRATLENDPRRIRLDSPAYFLRFIRVAEVHLARSFVVCASA